MQILLALFFLGLVSGKQQLHETPFDAAAYRGGAAGTPPASDMEFAPPPADNPFDAATYPVKWYRGGDAGTPPASDMQVAPPPDNPFDATAYPVKWYRGGDAGTPPASDMQFAPPPDNPFDAAAYPVKWYRGGDAGTPPASDMQAAPPPDNPFDAAAYPVKWYRGGDAGTPPAPDFEVPVHKEGTLMVKTGVLFLKRALFDGARLPANTKLGHAARRNSFISTTAPAPPPFAYSYLGDILNFYNITPGSVRARQVAATLLLCRDTAQQQEEPHACTTTELAAVEFATTALGKTPWAARTVVHGRGDPLRYVVSPNGITVIGDAVVPCHPLPYPAEVMYCHRPSGVQAVRVTLFGQEDPSLGATAIAVCHDDTAEWDEEYFLMLNGSRGEAICHYMPDNYLLWVATSTQ